MKLILNAAFAFAAVVLVSQAQAQVTFYEYPNFQGQSFTTNRRANNLANGGFNDRASSVIVAGNTAAR